MVWITVFGMLSLSWIIPSCILCVLIHRYISGKPPGYQSQLDLVIKEFLILNIIRNLTSFVYHLIGVFVSPIGPITSKILFFIVVNCPRIELSSLQTVFLVKAVLIFRGNWMAEITDSDVIWLSRRFILVYSSITCIVDCLQTPTMYPGLNFLTGSTEITSSLGPGPGIFFMLGILLISITILKIKVPKFPKEDEKEQIKRGTWMGLSVSMLGLIHMGLYVMFKHSPIALTLANQFVLNWVVKVGFTMYFIVKTPNLYDYVRKAFSLQKFLSPPNQVDCII